MELQEKDLKSALILYLWQFTDFNFFLQKFRLSISVAQLNKPFDVSAKMLLDLWAFVQQNFVVI